MSQEAGESVGAGRPGDEPANLDGPVAPEERKGLIRRFGSFLRASYAELQRVQWPDRQQIVQATGIVLVFVVLAGSYLGLLDAVFSRLVNAIL